MEKYVKKDTLRKVNVVLRPWMWVGQAQSKEDWPKITNARGTEVPITPRRYIVKLESTHRSLTTSQYPQDLLLSNLMDAIRVIHTYKRAPESRTLYLLVCLSIFFNTNNFSAIKIIR
jgi:hypothetical protein